MNKKGYEIYKKDGSEISPNSFSIVLGEDEKKDALIMTFADINDDDKRIDILSEIILTQEGVKSVFKRMLDVIDEYNKESNVDLFEEILAEIEESDSNGRSTDK